MYKKAVMKNRLNKIGATTLEPDESWTTLGDLSKDSEDEKAWTNNALPELTKWNQEFIKNYVPGTANANKIAPLIGFFPKDIFQEMKDKSPEEKYKWFYENEFKNLMTLNIPGQTGRLKQGVKHNRTGFSL